MNVPLFPAPPTLGKVATPVSDVVDFANPIPISLSAIAYARKHVGTKTRRAIGIRRIRHSTRRNLVYPKSKDQPQHRITEFRIRMTEQQRNDNDDDDDDDVVCAIDTPSTVSEEISAEYKTIYNVANFEKSRKSVETQTIDGLPLRLRVFPSIKDIVEEKEVNSIDVKGFSKVWKYVRFLGRLSLSLFGLLWLLTVWAVVGSVTFCLIEGPRELEQVVQYKSMQRDLAVGLSTELRQLRTEKAEDVEPLWSNKVQEYVEKHEQVLLLAVNAGYGESGNSGQLWTFPGCVLFALSLLTTLGFGAPVPRTTAGRTVTVIFAAIGVPAHLLLIMNFGLLIAVRLQKYIASRKFAGCDQTDSKHLAAVSKWIKIISFVTIASYYLLGILCFGVARSRSIAESVLFPLDFTAAGGLSTIPGHVRILYGLYLEGAVTIAAVAVAMLRVSTTQSLRNIGIKYGLLVEA